jgi:hypothetical protein
MSLVIEKLQERKAEILRGDHEKLGPGVAQRMSPAMGADDCIAQGDVYFVAGQGLPPGYTKVHKLEDKHRFLAWDNGTIGSNHKLDSLEGVEMWLPSEWSAESLRGPYFKCKTERVGTHPTHGHVIIPAGMEVEIAYPRDFDLEQKIARRSAD